MDGDGTCATVHLTWITMQIIQIVGRKHQQMKNKKAITSESSFHFETPYGIINDHEPVEIKKTGLGIGILHPGW